MKTLSDDITLKLPTTNMLEGYVNTTIYYNQDIIFAGRSYIPGNNSSLYININDFVLQNHGKNDVLKLNDDGKLTSTIDYSGESPKKWIDGQVGKYTVSISQNGTSYSEEELILYGYNYINKDITSSIIENDGDSELGRLMQGCNWQVIHEDERGNFTNTLLPRIPPIQADNFGLGLQIWTDQPDREYALRTNLGNEYNLGAAEFPNGSNLMFVTLRDLYSAGIARSFDSDSSIYLKYQGSSGDEFGDIEEGYTIADGWNTVDAMLLKRRLKDSGGLWQAQSYSRTGSPDKFRKYLNAWWLSARRGGLPESEYNNVDSFWWNIPQVLNNPDWRVYFYTSDLIDTTQATLEAYADFYFENSTDYNDAELSQMYEYQLAPRFVQTVDPTIIPDVYVGKCPIAIIEGCYSRYYLAWMDRYGDYMSQPFDGKIEYSEDFEKSEMKDYKLRRRIIHNELQPKWKLNSTWINEEFYPYYEAIFTSPYLLLFDTQTHRSWNVILSDNSYLEKTFKNQKKLFNLEINVECNQKQNYIF